MRLLKILSVLSIAGIILLSLFTWYSGDDYCYKLELLRYSVPRMLWQQYLYWDGRSLSIAAFVQMFSLKHFPIEVITCIWACSFVGTAILLLKILRLENPFFRERENSVITIAILCAVMWLGMWKLIPDIIYWSTGGSYSLLNMLAMLWLFFFLKGLKAERLNTVNYFFIFILSLVCGINSHNLIIALLVFCFIELGHQRVNEKNKKTSLYIVCALAGLLISGGFVFCGPGDKVRLNAISYHGFSGKFLYFYFLVLAKYCYWLVSLFLLCILVAWLSGKEFFFGWKNFITALKTNLNAFKSLRQFFLLLQKHKYAVTALATIVVFSATAFFAVPRTSIFFATFIVISIFKVGWKGEWKNHSKRLLYGSIALLSVFIFILSLQVFKAMTVKKEIAVRELLYNQNKKTDVVVPEISASGIPFAFTFTDISSDSSYWVNRCVARHYDLKTVRTVVN